MKDNIFYLLLIIELILSINSSTVIEISDYDYPTPSDEDSDIYNVAIMSTSDIHGAFFSHETSIPGSEGKYESGGLIYMGRYVSIMREQWKDRFIWLEGGDQFQGALETKISEGQLMTEFYNIMELNASTLGNHEWDFGQDYLKKRIENSKFPYIVSNLKNSTSAETTIFNMPPFKIFTAGKVKIAVIGMITLQTREASDGDLSNIDFIGYRDALEKHIDELRSQSDAVILLIHAGIECPDHGVEEKYDLKMRDKNTKMSGCDQQSELYQFLESLSPGKIDAVVAAHSHDVVHQWFFDFPVMQNKNNGLFASLMYLNFKKVDGKYQLIKDNIQFEGPLPVCGKVFENTKRCDPSIQEKKELGALVEFTFHKMEMKREEKLEELYKYWWEKYKEYREDVLTKTDGLMEVRNDQESGLANLFCDICRRTTGADIAVLNYGGFRVAWTPGNITVADLHNMIPFDNKLVSFKMTGKELKKMFFQIQRGDNSFYHVGGMKQVVSSRPIKRLKTVVLFDGYKEREIYDKETYTIVTNSFLVPNGGDDFSKVLKWYTPRDVVDYGDFKDAVKAYLRLLPEIVTSELIDKYNQRMRIVNIS